MFMRGCISVRVMVGGKEGDGRPWCYWVPVVDGEVGVGEGSGAVVVAS